MEFQKRSQIVFADLFVGTMKRLGVVDKNRPTTVNEVNDYGTKYSKDYISIMFVGSNPSTASPDNSPFHKGTKSRQTIDGWFKGADFNYHCAFANIINYKKQDNKKLTKSEINKNLPKISKRFKNLGRNKLLIAVGNDAQMTLQAAGVEHFKMPHPSGLNRFWNDKEAGEAKIQEMLEWLKTSHCQMVKRYQDLRENQT